MVNTVELIVPKIIPKVWGSEAIYANGPYCQKRMTLGRGKRCSLHYHRDKAETFTVESGLMLLEIEETPLFPRSGNDQRSLVQKVMMPGSAVEIRPFTAHRFTGLADETIFYEGSTHDDPADSVRLTQSEVIPAHEFVELLERYMPRGV